MKKRILTIICLILSITLFFTACKKKEKPVDIAKPEITKEQAANANNVEIKLLRYEQDLFKIDQKNLAANVAALYGKYPENLIQKNAWDNPEMLKFLRAYLNDNIIKQLYKDAQSQYADMTDFKKEMTSAMTLYLTHFPGEKIPDFCTLISGMDFESPSVFGYDTTIFINIDMYLGKDYSLYMQAGMPKFVAARCEKKYLATDCLTKGLVHKHLPETKLVTLLDNMIDAGKKMIFTQTLFPDRSASDILGYSKEQYNWAKSHESAVWHYFVEKDLLYGKSDDVTRRMFGETPFTRDFGNSSPGRIGWYIGYQIVQSYMKNHPGTTLKELLKMTDSQKFLKESGYKPA